MDRNRHLDFLTVTEAAALASSYWVGKGRRDEADQAACEAMRRELNAMDMTAVIAAIRNVKGVENVHDLHVWTVGPGVIACCCHVVVAEQTVREGQQVLRAVCGELDLKFKINHTTVQIEVEGHECGEMYCSIQPTEGSHVGHQH